MAGQALYLKWRPLTFEDVVGQEHITITLRNALVTGRIAHAYLFTGPRGTGKTTMARVLAKAVNCLAEDLAARPCNQCQNCVAVNEGRFLDLIEIDAASHTSVDDVRELRDRIAFLPNEGQYKVYIIDEVHRFSGAAFDALLKTLEEPPAHAIFVLATTEFHKVPQTIVSRCQRFDFHRIALNRVVERLWMMAEAEGIQAEQAALELIARKSTGSLRDAISLFDQLVTGPGETLTLELAQAVLGTAAGEAVQAITSALIAGDSAGGLDRINQTLDAGADPRQLARQMVEYLRLVMLVQTGGADVAQTLAPADTLAVIAEQAAQFPRRALLTALRAVNDAASETRGGWQPQLPLELALIESIEALYTPQDAPAAPQPSPPSARPAQTQAPTQSEPAPTTPESAPAPPPAPGAPSLAEVQKRWRQAVDVVRQHDKSVEALLNSGKLVGVEGHTVIFQVSADWMRDKIEAENNRKLIESVLEQTYGQPLKLRAKVRSGEADQNGEQIDDLIAGDSLIAFGVNELGGKVTTVKKQKRSKDRSEERRVG